MAKKTSEQVASIIHEAAVQEQREYETAKKRYVEILHADTGTEEHVQEFLRCSKILGKSAAEINADRKAITDAEAMVKQIEALAGHVTAFAAIEAIHNGHFERTQEQIQKLKAQHQRLTDVVSAAHALGTRDQKLREALAELRASNPGLLGRIPVPPLELASRDADPAALVPEFREWQAAHVQVQKVPHKLPGRSDAGSAEATAGA